MSNNSEKIKDEVVTCKECVYYKDGECLALKMDVTSTFFCAYGNNGEVSE